MGTGIDVKLLNSLCIKTYGEMTSTFMFSGVSVNSKKIKEGSLLIIQGSSQENLSEEMDSAIQGGAKAVLVDESIALQLTSSPLPVFIAKNVKVAIQEMAKHVLEEIDPTVIAIVGKDRGITADLTASILSKSYVINRPQQQNGDWLEVCLGVLNMDEETDVFIAEYSSRFEGELGELSQIVEPNVAMITGASSSDELTVFESLSHYVKIEDGMKASALTLIDGDNLDMVAYDWKTDAVPCGEGENCVFQITSTEDIGEEVLFHLKGVYMPFTVKKEIKPFLKNAVYGIAVAVHLGVLPDAMQPSLKEFSIKNNR